METLIGNLEVSLVYGPDGPRLTLLHLIRGYEVAAFTGAMVDELRALLASQPDTRYLFSERYVATLGPYGDVLVAHAGNGQRAFYLTSEQALRLRELLERAG